MAWGEHSFAVGTQVGRYVVLGRIGQGAMGIVIAAYDPQLDRKVAIKVLRRMDAGGDDRLRLQREAQALAKLRHPNVVAVYDAGVHDGVAFLAMEFVAGQTLREWLATEPPPDRRAVLRVLDAAGQGLAAAHAEGLVHRDFKPENVMVEPGGAARVMDFGLARLGSGAVDSNAGTERESADRTEIDEALNSVRERSSGDGQEITRAGALVGTPAYMSPEQFRGGEIDARTDQFSYCVTLYEALYGVRPFTGASILELGMSVVEGAVGEPPAGATIPAWLRRRLLRGLSASPDARYPDMRSLLIALSDDPGVRRRQWTTRGTIAAVAAASLWALGRPQPPAPVCQGLDADLRTVWNPERAERMRASMDATGLGFAASTAVAVERSIGRWGERWVEGREDACADTNVRGEQSETMLDRRMACLDRALRGLDSVAEVLVEADAALVSGAVELVGSLPILDRCDDALALAAVEQAPATAAAAAEARELDDVLIRVGVLESAGRLETAREEIAALAHRVEALDHPPTRARWLTRMGAIEYALGDSAASREHLEPAYRLAIQQRLDEVAAEAGAHLVIAHAADREGAAAARIWGIQAVELAKRTGAERLGVQAHNHLGIAALRTGDPDEAQRQFLESLRWLEAHEDRSVELGAVLNNLGILAYDAGRLADAREYYERARDVFTEVLGEGHPNIAASENNLGNTAEARADYDQALAHYAAALRIRKAAFGEEHDAVASTHSNMGNLESSRQNHGAARAHYDRALEIRRAVLEPGDARIGYPLNGRGYLELATGEFSTAVDTFDEVLRLWEAAWGGENRMLAWPLTGLALAHAELGHFDQGLAAGRRAVQLRSDANTDPVERADSRFALAAARWLAGTSSDGESIAAIVGELRGMGAHADASLGIIDRWLARHPDARKANGGADLDTGPAKETDPGRAGR
jgi:tetratricopeptide (TPR) repeat protein/tRNA A-37 threonylcarbamoyl transferase component Bud32